VTNLEKLRTGTDEEIESILIKLVLKSSNVENINYEKRVLQFMNEEAKVNQYGIAVVCH
jgi:hypothetical protein